MKKEKLPAELQAYFAPFFEAADADTDYGEDWLGQVITSMSQVSSLAVASQMLKERGLHWTVTGWKKLRTERIEPALSEGQLSKDQVLQMLADMEEHGRQHVLLYQLKPEFGSELGGVLDANRVKRELLTHNFSRTFDRLPTPRTPSTLTLTHVRFEGPILVFKALEAKIARRQIYSFPLASGQEIQLEKTTLLRRAKIARLHPNGLLEVRLGALEHARNDHGYDTEADAFLRTFQWLVQPAWFNPAHLGIFKRAVWEQRTGDRIQVLNQNLASNAGNTVALKARHRRTNIASDAGVCGARKAVLAQQGSSSGRIEVLWPARTGFPQPHADITIRTTEKINEFSIGQAISAADYEYVFGDITRLGNL